MDKTSGSSSPKILPHSKVKKINKVPEIMGKFCYIVESYPDAGFSLLLHRADGKINFKFGTFDGKDIDVMQDVKYKKFINMVFKKVNEYIKLLNFARVNQLQLYFVVKNNNVYIADARTHFNKYLGPGMIRDVIAKCGIPFLKVYSTEEINEESVERLVATGNKYVIRPSYPKTIVRDGELEPLQARI